MAPKPERIDVYLELGEKRVFASAADWPGWSRGGRDEASALQSLVDYGRQYASVMKAAGLPFEAPAETTGLRVIERLQGDVTTDFGAPGVPPACDAHPVNAADLERFRLILSACWKAIDLAARKAGRKPLRKGPRGGGRELEDILRHDSDAEGAYLSRVSFKLKSAPKDESLRALQRRTRTAILDALGKAAQGGLPERGPRGGARWSARFFARKTAWHTLDHAWEIEDRCG